MSILVDKELEYARQAHHKNKEIGELRMRVELLEKQHAVNLEKFRQHASDLRISVSQDLETASVDAAGLRRLLKLKNHELRQMKALASTILDQRSETESFFMEALAEVKEAILVERRQEQRQRVLEGAGAGEGGGRKSRHGSSGPGVGSGGGWGTGERALRGSRSMRLPSLSHKPSHTQPSSKTDTPLPTKRLATPETDKVHIRDLSWGDKELVLRVLFAKLNQSKQRKLTDKAAAGTQQSSSRRQQLMDLASNGSGESSSGRGRAARGGEGEPHSHEEYDTANSPFFVSEGAGMGMDGSEGNKGGRDGARGGGDNIRGDNMRGDFLPGFVVDEMNGEGGGDEEGGEGGGFFATDPMVDDASMFDDES